MDKDERNKLINVLDQVRIEPLIKEIRNEKIEFKYWITLVYPRRTTNYNKVLSDNTILDSELTRFFGSEVKSLYAIEKHTSNDGAHSSGYHRHILIEEPNFNTKNVLDYLLHHDPEALFEFKLCCELNESSKLKIIEHVLRSSRTTCNSRKGVQAALIQSNFKRVLAYMTKQFEVYHPSYEVIDPTNSDIDCSFLLKYKQDGLQYQTRQIHLPQGSIGALRYAYR